MSNMIKIPLTEAKQMESKKGKKAQFIEEYIGYITDLKNDEAGTIKINSEKEGYFIRRRIERAANKLGLAVNITKVGDAIVFWKE